MGVGARLLRRSPAAVVCMPRRASERVVYACPYSLPARRLCAAGGCQLQQRHAPGPGAAHGPPQAAARAAAAGQAGWHDGPCSCTAAAVAAAMEEVMEGSSAGGTTEIGDILFIEDAAWRGPVISGPADQWPARGAGQAVPPCSARVVCYVHHLRPMISLTVAANHLFIAIDSIASTGFEGTCSCSALDLCSPQHDNAG